MKSQRTSRRSASTFEATVMSQKGITTQESSSAVTQLVTNTSATFNDLETMTLKVVNEDNSSLILNDILHTTQNPTTDILTGHSQILI